VNGANVRRRITKKLVRRSDDFQSEKDVWLGCTKEIDAILAPINARQHQPENGMSLADFTENRFLPHIQEKIAQGYKKPSTAKFYKDVFNSRLKNSVGGIALRDFTTRHAQDLLDDIDKKKNLSHKSLQHQDRTECGLHLCPPTGNYPVRESGARCEGRGPSNEAGSVCVR
jgi:hypothetical protein